MNLLDVAIIVLVIAAGFGGWRLGFVTRAFAWAGVAVALVIGIHFVPNIVTNWGGTSADDRVTVAVLFLVLVATIGQAIGMGIGLFAKRVLPSRTPMPWWDRSLGAFLGVAGVLLLVWMIIPSLATAKGWPARMARGSAVVGAIDDWAPTQPSQFAAWGRSISEAPFPSALGPLDDPPNPGPPPKTALPAAVAARARASTVKVSGQACDQIQDGSGWVAAPGIVVTNAHVVAGEPATSVEDANGRAHDATVIAFDGTRDLAVLSVPGLSAQPLPLTQGSVGDVGAVFGHPGGGPLVASPARVGDEIVAVGTDITRNHQSRRHVYVLASTLKPGDSGGALVDTNGDVIGVAFAIDPAHSGTSYALTDAEVRPVLDDAVRGARTPVDTGKCLVD
jgi:S1-C subfamily serine protease